MPQHGVVANIGKDTLCESSDIADVHVDTHMSPLSRDELVRV